MGTPSPPFSWEAPYHVNWFSVPEATEAIHGVRAEQMIDEDGLGFEPCSYVDSRGTKVPIEETYQRLLHPPLRKNTNNTCCNSELWQWKFPPVQEDGIDWFPTYLFYLARDTTYGYLQSSEMGIVHGLFASTRASLLQHCKCTLEPGVLDLIPCCTSWPALERWVIQLVACGSLNSSGSVIFPAGPASAYYSAVINRLQKAIIQANVGRPLAKANEHDTLQWKLDPAYRRWESKVDLADVCGLVSWLCGISREYLYIQPVHGFDSDDRMLVEFERAKSLGLCPHRVWGLVSNAPGRDLNLQALVPAIDSPPDGWRHSHQSCTRDFCERSTIDFSTVEQLHLCANRDCLKNDRLFPQEKLVAAVSCQNTSRNYVPTAWALDGQTIVREGMSFMAISHVWSDGTGTGVWQRGVVNICVWEFFCGIARELGCEGVWWDSICLPTEKRARAKAINRMHNNYANATVTLVHDRYLSTFQWVNAAEACFAFVMSSWFTRGWTALELANSRNVKVLYSNNGKPIVKDLDAEILAIEGELSQQYHLFATTLVQNLRRNIQNINGLLSSLGPRYTSKSRDKAMIAGLLTGVEDPGFMTQEQTYQEVLKHVKNVERGNLFHGAITMQTSGFNWCPTDLFKMPLHHERARSPLTVMENGDLVGIWQWSCLAAFWKRIEKPVEGTHPIIQAKLQSALSDKHKHLLLTQTTYSRKGIIVKVAVDLQRRDEIRVELVGSVDLHKDDDGTALKSNASWFIMGNISHLPELPPGLKACAVPRQFSLRYTVPKYIFCCQGD